MSLSYFLASLFPSIRFSIVLWPPHMCTCTHACTWCSHAQALSYPSLSASLPLCPSFLLHLCHTPDFQFFWTWPGACSWFRWSSTHVPYGVLTNYIILYSRDLRYSDYCHHQVLVWLTHHSPLSLFSILAPKKKSPPGLQLARCFCMTHETRDLQAVAFPAPCPVRSVGVLTGRSEWKCDPSQNLARVWSLAEMRRSVITRRIDRNCHHSQKWEEVWSPAEVIGIVSTAMVEKQCDCSQKYEKRRDYSHSWEEVCSQAEERGRFITRRLAFTFTRWLSMCLHPILCGSNEIQQTTMSDYHVWRL